MTSCNSYINSKLDLSKNNANNANNIRSFTVQDLTSIKSDRDYIDYDIIQSKGSADHIFTNYNNNNRDKLIDIATQNATINFRDGKGTNNDNINVDTEVRIGKVKHERKHQKQLFQRPYLTIPYIGKGELNVDNESYLLSSNDTGQHKQCNSLAGVYLENQFTPLVPNLENNIQNTNNLIPEDNRSNWIDDKSQWIRGGISTRNIVKDVDYLGNCNADDAIKKALVEKNRYNR